MTRLFTLDEARDLLAEIRPVAEEIVGVRADFADQRARHEAGEPVAIADLKAAEARLSDLLDGLTARGIEVKGFAPLLLDFPSVLEGEDVLLCWLEGEAALEWYHPAAQGFPGRRRIPV